MTTRLQSFGRGYRAAIWGAGGGLGRAFLRHLSDDPGCREVVAISRAPAAAAGKVRPMGYDPADPQSIDEAARGAANGGSLDLVVVATGTLHGEDYGPEKALRQLAPEAFLEVVRINTLLPALIARASVGDLSKERSVFAALSARVGSIADNRLGGWYSYRASKAALNQVLRNVAIEVARKNKGAVIAGLHPGTVDTGLSEPFQANVPEGKLFTPDYSAGELLSVIDRLTADQSGLVFDYAGKPVPA